MPKINTIAVYCGSSSGFNPAYKQCAEELGNSLLKHNIHLIYGSGKLGLMGVISKTVDEGGGKVIGIIPQFLKEIDGLKTGYGEEIVVKSMHQRKEIMAKMADAFIALPGGVGTMEELIEIVTWRQLKLHHKPIGILNFNGYYDKFIEWLSKANKEGFISEKDSKYITISSKPDELLLKLMSYSISTQSKY